MPKQIFSASITFNVFLSVLQAGFLFVTAFIMSRLTLIATEGLIDENVVPLGIGFFVLVMLYHIVAYLGKMYANNMMEKKLQSYRELIYEKMLLQNISVTEKLGIAGMSMYLERHLGTFLVFMVKTIPSIISGLIICITFFFFFIYLDLLVGIALLALSLVKIIPPIIIKKYIQGDYGAINEEGLKWFRFVLETLAGLLTIKTFTLKNWYKNKLNAINANQITAYSNKFVHVGQEESLNNAANAITTIGVYVFLGILVLYGHLNVGPAVAIAVLSGNFFMSSSQMYMALPRFFEYKIAKSKLIELIYKKNPDGYAQGRPHGDIIYKVENLSFRYEHSSPYVLNNFSMDVRKGEKVAIIGKNGAGKSTLIKLLLKHHDKYDGTIELCGRNILTYKDEDVYSTVSFLPQNDSALDFTVGELVNFFEKYTRNISDIANQLGFYIDKMKDSLVSNLSGGEFKKLELAICLAKQVYCCILDEPTNSLDSNSKNALKKILNSYDKSLIIVTHDDELLECCDASIVLS